MNGGKIKIAINCSYFIPKGGGIKEYIQNLVCHLIKMDNKGFEFIFYIANGQEKFWGEHMPSGLHVKTTPYKSNQQIKRSLFQQKFWYQEEKEEQFTIFHSPFLYSPKFKKAKIILTVHDLRFKVFPETYTFLRGRYLMYKVPKSLKKADHIVSISDFTKLEIIKHFRTPSSKITVIHEAVNASSFNVNNQLESDRIKESGLIAGEYLLAVGHVEPRKNYVRLIEAIDQLNSELGANLKLVIVGKTSFKSDESIQAIQHSPNVIYLNFVEFGELLWLYNNCKFHIFPSIYEGFGFPSLEAAIFGKATAGANVSSIPEITGEGGIYFDPFSTEDMKMKIKALYSNEKLLKEKSLLAVKNLEGFSWKRNAEQTIQVYHTLT